LFQFCYKYDNILKKCRALILEDGLEFMKYAINIEKASMIYLSPVQKEYVKRKCLDLEAARFYVSVYIESPGL
jgi:hypothetical protein